MKRCLPVCIALVVASEWAAGQEAQTGPRPDARRGWLSELVGSFEENRTALERVDPRNRKLFGNADFLRDIDEKARCVGEANYDALVKRASSLLEQQFPPLRPAFSAGATEAAVSFSAGAVFVRGRADAFDFAAAVPTAVAGNDFSNPLTITLVARSAKADGGVAEALARFSSTGRGRDPQALTQALSELADVSIQRVLDAKIEGGLTRIEAEGALNGMGAQGRLRLLVSGRVTRLELSGGEPMERCSRKPFAVKIHSRGQIIPDWVNERNVVPTDPERSGGPLPPMMGQRSDSPGRDE